MESSPLANCSKWSLSAIWKWVSSVYQDVAPIICATALQRRPHNRGAAAVCSSPSLPAPALPLMCMAHPPLQVPPEKVIPWRRVLSWEPPGGKILAEGGSFPLGEGGGRFLRASLQGECGAGHSAGRCCRSEYRASALGCPTSTSGGQNRRRACEAISLLGYGCLKAVPTAGRSGTGTQLGTWTWLVWNFGQVFCLPQPLSTLLCPPSVLRGEK